MSRRTTAKGRASRAPQRNSTQRSQQQATLYEALAGRAIPDHELNVLGFSNVTRRYDHDDPSNGPSAVFRVCGVFDGFCKGYSNTSWSDGDSNAAIDTTTADPTTPLIAVCSMARYFEEDVWPILDNLFASGTGERHPIGINEFVRYTANVLTVYADLLQPVLINKLTFHTDWSKIAPFTNVIPSYMYQLVENLDCTDVGLAERWLPLMRQVENFTMFPRMLAETKRFMTPMLSVDLHGRVQIPMKGAVAGYDADVVFASVQDRIDYLNKSNMEKAVNVIASFFPFPIRDMDPWSLPDLPLIDPDRDTGWYNSIVKSLGWKSFNDTDDPTVKDCCLFDESAGSKALFYTRHCQPIWAEVRCASIYELTDEVVDDKWRLITPHRYANITILDDAFDAVIYNGSLVDAGDLGYRYLDYANCRFADAAVDYGIQKPGLIGSEFTLSTVERMMRLDTQYMFNLDVLRAVNATMAGASIRELKWSIKDMVIGGVSKPI